MSDAPAPAGSDGGDHDAPVQLAELTVRPIDHASYLSELEAAPGQFFALLDACDEPKVPVLAKNLGDDAVSLYRGRAEEELWAIAPYLVALDKRVAQWVLDELSGTPYGILISAATNLETLRKHFRRFLMVESPEGKQLYFRYYDPRILPTFLTSSTADEVNAFFGPVHELIVPDDDGLLSAYSNSQR
ncbi:MAG: DUF4123 domain-containing protein [Planctomycetota bacterium]